MTWWNPFTWVPAPSIGRGTQVDPPPPLISNLHFDSPKNILRRKMFAKDPELAAQFWSGSAGKVLREWQAKYPEDFVGVIGSTSAASVLNNPDHVK